MQRLRFASWIYQQLDALSEEKKILIKAMISYEKRVDVVASDTLVIRRLLRDNVERRAGAPRGRRFAVVIAIIISQRRFLTFPSSRSIVPGNVRRRAARAFRTFACAD